MVANRPLLAIVGPTASGKSALSLRIAQQFDGEIICADSRTIYTGMDIGTAKPSGADQTAVRHWLLDQVEPGKAYSVAEFKQAATAAVNDILSRGKLPILVGGSGLYIDAFIYDYQLGSQAVDGERQRLDALNLEQLQAELQQVDPAEYQNVDLSNKRRVIRAIERAGERPQKRQKPLYQAIIVGISPSPEQLYTNIVQRNQIMLKNGLIEETQRLLDRYGAVEALNTVPYKQVIEYIKDDITAEQALEQMDIKDRQLAKRQYTWFKRNPDITWYNDGDSAFAHLEAILEA